MIICLLGPSAVLAQSCSPPELIAPEDWFYIAIDDPFTIEWSEVPYADYYVLQWFTGDLENPDMVKDFVVESNTFPTSLQGTYDCADPLHWRVKTHCASGDSDWSEIRHMLTVPPTCAPPILAAPADWFCIHIDDFFTMSWEPVDCALYYVMEWSSDCFATSENTSVHVVEGNEFYTSLQGSYPCEAPLCWRVKAICVDGESEWSEVWHIYTACQIPIVLAPEDWFFVPIDEFFTFEWEPVGCGATYLLQWSTDDFIDPANITEYELDEPVFTTSLQGIYTGDAPLYWRFKTICECQDSEWSPVRHIVTTCATVELLAPEDCFYIPRNEFFDISWMTVDGAVYYEMHWSPDNFETPENIRVFELEEATFYTSLQGYYTAASPLCWRVRAVSADGPGAWSETRHFITLRESLPPLLLSPDDLLEIYSFDTPIAFAWEAAVCGEEYVFQFAEGDFDDPVQFAEYSSSTPNLTGSVADLLGEAVLTRWRVCTVFDGVWGDWSEVRRIQVRLDPPTDAEETPSALALSVGPSYPNPFNPRTRIPFVLPQDGVVGLDIYDVAGRRVRTLLHGQWMGAGTHERIWDGRLDGGEAAASGIYFARLHADGYAVNTRLTLLK
ncbi:MAG: hypothetical protein JW819_06725 [Candidatus Krumholzibacteriota bacterium]|nr:hypothetical protein [Candidatus Krumholzibacteriota bacterium]